MLNKKYRYCMAHNMNYTACPVIDDTIMYGVILYKRISRKYTINFFHMTFCFQENEFENSSSILGINNMPNSAM